MANDLTPEMIAKLQRLVAKAKASPWFVGKVQKDDYDCDFVTIGPFQKDDHYEDTIARVEGENYDCSANASLIVAAVNALPVLLAAAERPSNGEVDDRARSLEIYADGVAKIATSDNTNQGWLKGLELGLRNTAALLRKLSGAGAGEWQTLQRRVADWMQACFGPKSSADKIERNHRFIEEALELVQACGCTKSEAHQLVDYVYDRPRGDINQEIGGVMVTLAALCLANGFDMHDAGEVELARVWTKIEKIRAKQAAKPKYSPLPEPPK